MLNISFPEMDGLRELMKVNVLSNLCMLLIVLIGFFQNYYTVFDYENNAIGFAPSINMG
jgi:hypothetical protein